MISSWSDRKSQRKKSQAIAKEIVSHQYDAVDQAERNLTVATLRCEQQSCKTCSHLGTKLFFKWCKKKDKRIAEYNICHLHERKLA